MPRPLKWALSPVCFYPICYGPALFGGAVAARELPAVIKETDQSTHQELSQRLGVLLHPDSKCASQLGRRKRRIGVDQSLEYADSVLRAEACPVSRCLVGHYPRSQYSIWGIPVCLPFGAASDTPMPR